MTGEVRGPTGARLEFERRDLGVGCFLLAAAALFLAVAGVAFRDRLFQRSYRLNTSFVRIEGLQAGAEVQLRGYKIGEVTRIGLATKPDFRFDVEFDVAEGIRLPAGSRARLSFRGLGSKFLEILTPGDAGIPAAAADRPQVFLAAGDRLPGDLGTDLDAILGDAQLALRRFVVTIERFDALLDERVGPAVDEARRLLRVDLPGVSDETRATLREAGRLLDESRAALADSRPRTARVLELAEEDLAAGRDLIRRADEVMGRLDESIATTTARLSASLARAESILAKVDGAVREEDLRASLASLREAAAQAEALLEELHRRPWRLLRRVDGEKEALERELEQQPAPPPPPQR